MSNSSFIVHVNAQSFQTLVLNNSVERPVLVDFWASWCGPCQALMPILAKLAEEYNGRFLLAKINTDIEQALAMQFGIRSLPTVQLFYSGRVVDQFMGALPENQIRAFLERNLPRASANVLAKIKQHVLTGDLNLAQAALEQAQTEDPENTRLKIAEIQLIIARGDLDQALVQLDSLPIDLINDPEVMALRGQLRFAQALQNAPSEIELNNRLANNMLDHQARYQLAAHLVIARDYPAALEHLLELMRHSRAFGEDAGRKGMLAVFDILGGSGELVVKYRARMMNALY